MKKHNLFIVVAMVPAIVWWLSFGDQEDGKNLPTMPAVVRSTANAQVPRPSEVDGRSPNSLQLLPKELQDEFRDPQERLRDLRANTVFNREDSATQEEIEEALSPLPKSVLIEDANVDFDGGKGEGAAQMLRKISRELNPNSEVENSEFQTLLEAPADPSMRGPDPLLSDPSR
jgi:hypothetical protein